MLIQGGKVGGVKVCVWKILLKPISILNISSVSATSLGLLFLQFALDSHCLQSVFGNAHLAIQGKHSSTENDYLGKDC